MMKISFLKSSVLILSTFLFITSHAQSLVSNWTYVEIDSLKSKWGDFGTPNWLRYFGLDMGDLNGDGLKDILTGRNVYLNPGGEMEAPWKKVDLGLNVDGILIMDVDGDKYLDIIGQALPNIYWIEARDNVQDQPRVIADPHRVGG